jgi:hypothetical protein
MAPSSVPSSPALVNAAQAQHPSPDDARRSKSSSGPRDRATSSSGTAAPPGASTERATDSLEPDWAATTDAATD